MTGQSPRTQMFAFLALAAVFLVFAILAFSGGNTLIGVFAVLFVVGNAGLAYKLHRSGGPARR